MSLRAVLDVLLVEVQGFLQEPSLLSVCRLDQRRVARDEYLRWLVKCWRQSAVHAEFQRDWLMYHICWSMTDLTICRMDNREYNVRDHESVQCGRRVFTRLAKARYGRPREIFCGRGVVLREGSASEVPPVSEYALSESESDG